MGEEPGGSSGPPDPATLGRWDVSELPLGERMRLAVLIDTAILKVHAADLTPACMAWVGMYRHLFGAQGLWYRCAEPLFYG